MYRDKFYSQLNKVFLLMLENKLCEDIDDTLLEKLLSIIKLEVHKKDFIDDLLENTEALFLCEKTIIALLNESKKFSTSTTVFSIRLLGLIFKNQDTFQTQKFSPVGIAFSNIANPENFFKCSPSVQNAILTFFLSVATYPEGALWLIQCKLFQLAFASFSSTSYYVKKTAGIFISSSMQLWTNPDFSPPSHLPMDTFDKAVKNIMFQLISNIQVSKDSKIGNVSNCCISTLKQILENNVNIQSYHLEILQTIEEYFKSLSKDDEIDVIDLLLAVLRRDSPNMILIKRLIQLLAKNRMFSTAFHLSASFLSSFEEYRPLTRNNIYFLLMPFDIVNKVSLPNDEDTFQVASKSIYSSMQLELITWPKGLRLVSSSLQALTKLTSFMNSEVITTVLSSIQCILELLPKDYKPEDYAHENNASYIYVEYRIVSFPLLELFASLLIDNVYATMHIHCKKMLIQCLIRFIPSTDSNIVSEALRLLKCVIVLNGDHTVLLDEIETLDFVKLLGRRIFDHKESIVDNSLHLAGEMMTGKGHVLWEEAIFKESVHMIIWDIAVQGSNDGVIKASALKILTEICLQPHFLQDIKSKKEIDEVDIMRILCNFVHDPDFFVQREAIQSLCKWMKNNEKLLSLSCKDNMFAILTSAIRSLDLELKLIALEAWHWCIEKSTLFPPLSQPNLNHTLAAYCSSGFGASLIYALDDYDEAVKYKAANIMFELQTKLVRQGYTKGFMPPETTKSINSPQSADFADFVTMSVSTEERNEGIDNVMKMTTAEQLLSICKITDFPNHNSYLDFPSVEIESLTCSASDFWNSIWSDKLTIILKTEETPMTAFSDYSLSLLDDIIAAEVIHYVNDTPDCY